MNSVERQKYFTVTTSFAICTVILGLVTVLWDKGLLQFLEFKCYDQFMAWRTPRLSDDSRVVLVKMDEDDIRGPTLDYPLTDIQLAELLEHLESYEPCVIGLDLFRDLPVPKSGVGIEKLNDVLLRHTNIIVIRKYGDKQGDGIPPPPILKDQPDRVALNDIPWDKQIDERVRRALLYMDDKQGQYFSLAFSLALTYLEEWHRLSVEADPNHPGFIRLGRQTLPRLAKHDGGYRHLDAAGYQILVDFKAPNDFPTYTVTQILSNALPGSALDEELKKKLKNRILIVGVMAVSVKDNITTPVNPKQFGLEFHGQVVDQLLRAALEGDEPIRFMTEWQEFLWLLIWCLIGTLIGFIARTLREFTVSVVGGLALLAIVSWWGFSNDWWFPIAVPALGFVPATGFVTAFQHQQEHKQRAILMKLFGKMVSPQIAETIWIQRGDFLEGQRPRPQRLTATLLFTDMKDFTTACEQMDAADVTDWLNEYMEIMSKQVLDRGGIINEYIGDSIMATFGIPVPRTTEEEINDDAVSAVKSAVAMAEELDRLNERWKKVGKRTTAMRVGIFTGPVVTGSLGGTERMKYSVVGDTVNTAARLQSFDRSINDPESPHPDCRVLVGDPTWRRLGGRFQGKKVGEFDLKGKKERVTIWQVFNGKLKGEET